MISQSFNLIIIGSWIEAKSSESWGIKIDSLLVSVQQNQLVDLVVLYDAYLLGSKWYN